MPLLRRAVPLDPRVVARLAAVLPGDRGWTPPAAAGLPGAGGPPPGTAGATPPSPARARAGRHATTKDLPAWPAPLPELPPDLPHQPADPAPHAPPDLIHDLPPLESDVPPVPPASGPSVPSVLARWREGRVDPGRRGLAALAVVGLLAAVLAGAVVLRARPDVVAAPDVVASGTSVPGSSAVPRTRAGTAATAASPAGSTAPGTTAAGTPTAAEVVVAVAGKVVRPGLLRLPVGSRVDDAVRAAGGALPGADLTGLNLARRLVDGEQVVVGLPQPPTASAPDGSAPAADGLVDLNTATVAQFDTLPGIGPVLAQKLVDWRTEHGGFGSVDQLREVGGIGESKYAEIKDKVRV